MSLDRFLVSKVSRAEQVAATDPGLQHMMSGLLPPHMMPLAAEQELPPATSSPQSPPSSAAGWHHDAVPVLKGTAPARSQRASRQVRFEWFRIVLNGFEFGFDCFELYRMVSNCFEWFRMVSNCFEWFRIWFRLF